MDKRSVMIAHQLRTVDEVRLLRRLGQLSFERMAEIDDALRLTLGLGYPAE